MIEVPEDWESLVVATPNLPLSFPSAQATPKNAPSVSEAASAPEQEEACPEANPKVDPHTKWKGRLFNHKIDDHRQRPQARDGQPPRKHDGW